MKSGRLKKWLIVLFCACGVWILLGYIFVWRMTATAADNYSFSGTIGSHRFDTAAITTSDGVRLHAWYSAVNPQQEVVILLPGIRANSSYMHARAKMYLDNGRAVLMPDLRGTGRSGGDAITFGWKERLDLLACVRWLEAKGHTSVAAHGCSLGAATIAYSLDSVNDYSFVVMESCYDNIDHALAHRTFESGFNRALLWPVYFFAEQKIGATADQLSPLSCVPRYKGPVLYLAGDNESQIPVEETQQLFSSFKGEGKLVMFTGATHCDLHHYNSTLYESTLREFLQSRSTP